MPESERKPSWPSTIEVRPPRGEENRQPVHATWLQVSGGGSAPVTIDFYYLSFHAFRRIALGETGDGIERLSDDHLVYRSLPAASVTLPVASAADLIVNLYRVLQNNELRYDVDRKLGELSGTTEEQG